LRVSAPVVARAQTRKPTIGELSISVTDYAQAAFEQGLADFGYVVGQNTSLIAKDAAGHPGRLNQLAAELFAAKVDVIYSPGSQPTNVLKHLTTRVPIVMVSTNPVGLGFVTSLARPGGNITGLSLLGPEIAAKRLQLLKELIPEAVRAAVLWNPDDPGAQFSFSETQVASKALAIDLLSIEARTTDDIDKSFATATKEVVQAVIVLPAPFLGTNAGRISQLALAYRLPTFAFRKEEAKAGQLLAFGSDIPATGVEQHISLTVFLKERVRVIYLLNNRRSSSL
jgi:putative ABC transport system substrate-binding protein